MKCKNCETNEAIKYSKYTNGLFCSKECSKAYSTKEKRVEINKKISNTLTGSGNDKVILICEYCHENFTVKWNRRHQKYCSLKCSRIGSNSNPIVRDKLSKKRISAIKNGIINGAGKKSKYIFNNIEINCDSKIENSCINYFEKLGATKIKRSEIIIDYIDNNNNKRRFLPDFEIELNNKKYLVEAKGYMTIKTLDMKWREYNIISEIKKEALKKYCEKNNLKPFWFTKDLNRKYYDSI